MFDTIRKALKWVYVGVIGNVVADGGAPFSNIYRAYQRDIDHSTDPEKIASLRAAQTPLIFFVTLEGIVALGGIVFLGYKLAEVCYDSICARQRNNQPLDANPANNPGNLLEQENQNQQSTENLNKAATTIQKHFREYKTRKELNADSRDRGLLLSQAHQKSNNPNDNAAPSAYSKRKEVPSNRIKMKVN